jgi:5'-nucleotidase
MDDRIGLFDMDGTLFDYEGQMRKDLADLMSPGEEMPDDLWDESVPHLKARMKLIKSQPGWWRNLPKLELGWRVYEVAKAIGFKNQILTKGPASHPVAWMEKVQCIKDHFGNEVYPNIVGEDKSGYYGRFLCDDYPDYALGWLKHRPRGVVLMPSQRCNRGFYHQNVIKFDESTFPVVEVVLKAVYARESGRDWREYLP